jgi:hypothetical protein
MASAAVTVRIVGSQAGLVEYLEGLRDAHNEAATDARRKSDRDRHTYQAEGLEESLAILRSWENTGDGAKPPA